MNPLIIFEDLDISCSTGYICTSPRIPSDEELLEIFGYDYNDDVCYFDTFTLGEIQWEGNVGVGIVRYTENPEHQLGNSGKKLGVLQVYNRHARQESPGEVFLL